MVVNLVGYSLPTQNSFRIAQQGNKQSKDSKVSTDCHTLLKQERKVFRFVAGHQAQVRERTKEHSRIPPSDLLHTQEVYSTSPL
jgi:hypothetical protein